MQFNEACLAIFKLTTLHNRHAFEIPEAHSELIFGWLTAYKDIERFRFTNRRAKALAALSSGQRNVNEPSEEIATLMNARRQCVHQPLTRGGQEEG